METPEELREKARRYRQMIPRATDEKLKEALRTLAEEYDALANQLEGEGRQGG